MPIVFKVIFMFSWVYVRYYQDHLESEVSTTITAIIALTITLITSAMVPLDIFLVSYMKNSDGTFKVMQSGGGGGGPPLTIIVLIGPFRTGQQI
jgi:hypothetical protein